MDSDSYTYSPLEAGEIRLIHLPPMPDPSNVRFRIKIWNLEDTPPYRALSYTWGDTSPLDLVPITCDGKTLMITRSLKTALQAVLSPDAPDTPWYLWVDQICINQKDQHEKQMKIGLMRDIYTRASQVMIHLGAVTPSELPNSGLGVLNRVASFNMSQTEPPPDKLKPWDSVLEVEKYIEQAMKDYYTPRKRITVEKSMKELGWGVSFDNYTAWRDFCNLFDRPWFERVWAAQEILLACNPVAVWGTEFIPWDRVRNAALWYHNNAQCIHKKHPLKVDGIKAVVELDRFGFSGGSESETKVPSPTVYSDPFLKAQWDFKLVLNAFRNRKSSDPRDKVYGLFGLSHPNLTIDYSKSIKQVYTETALSIIHATGNLDILLDAINPSTFHSDDPTWPSWVPDWRTPITHGCASSPNNSTSKIPSWWHSSSQYHLNPSPSSFKLKVNALILGQIKPASYLSPFTHAESLLCDLNTSSGDGIRQGLACTKALLPIYYNSTQESLEIAYALTLMGGNLPASFTEKGTTVEEYTDNYVGWIDYVKKVAETGDESELVQYWKLGFDETWVERLKIVCCHRRFFVTDMGIIGLGNEMMKEGDLVVRLEGLSVPCVAQGDGRKWADGDQFEFVGEAYCHGMMHDNSFDSDDGHAIREFVLR
ncbi:heterokaryon incompatibility protein-domain-containing protein [Podospora fimiseda]|uniref:Heterokaryon incompatibility protein-domain-containing protein n=1 Tax=Podospora fimiseda TaxID=252190 RepID=A0AAN7BF57_9PEZI|nr:heterokaryon incompatibility protein-domain-containing protein [Podospora fimiseda]